MACSFSALHCQNTGMITEQCDKIHLFHPLSKILLHSIILFLPFLSPLALSLSPLISSARWEAESWGFWLQRACEERGEKRERMKWEHLLSSSTQRGRAQPCQSHRQPAATHTHRCTNTHTRMSYSGINPHSSSQSHCLTHIEESNSRSQTRMTSSQHRELYTSSGMPVLNALLNQP